MLFWLFAFAWILTSVVMAFMLGVGTSHNEPVGYDAWMIPLFITWVLFFYLTIPAFIFGFLVGHFIPASD
jgi:hypothetical protein